MRRCVISKAPKRYTPRDAADAFSEALGTRVEVQVIPREAWKETFLQFGFSKAAGRSYACMTATVVDQPAGHTTDVERGTTALTDYIRRAVRPKAAP